MICWSKEFHDFVHTASEHTTFGVNIWGVLFNFCTPVVFPNQTFQKCMDETTICVLKGWGGGGGGLDREHIINSHETNTKRGLINL